MGWPAGAAGSPPRSTPTRSGKQHTQVGCWAGGALYVPALGPAFTPAQLQRCTWPQQCMVQKCLCAMQPRSNKPHNLSAYAPVHPPIHPPVIAILCCAAANVTRSAAWSAGVAPPVITYLMAMNHEPVVNSGEVSRAARARQWPGTAGKVGKVGLLSACRDATQLPLLPGVHPSCTPASRIQSPLSPRFASLPYPAL